jgi:hypothetical protein
VRGNEKTIEFSVYLAGVILLSWNYYKLKSALDIPPLFAFVVFYLLGISKFATWISDYILHNKLSKRGDHDDQS